MRKLIRADFTFSEEEMGSVPAFNQLKHYTDMVFVPFSTYEGYYTCIGTFTGFNGVDYVALKLLGAFKDIICVTYSEFDSYFQMKV